MTSARVPLAEAGAVEESQVAGEVWEPGPNWDLAPAGPFFEALAQAYRVADLRDRAALRYAYPTLGALLMAGG